MLLILLNILKITGIVLLCIIGFVLFVLLLVLFVPIRYRLSGFKDEDEYGIDARISWLLHLVRVMFSYPEPGEVSVKVLFFEVFNSKLNNNDEDEENEFKYKNISDEKPEAQEMTDENSKNDKNVKEKDKVVSAAEYEKKYNQDIEKSDENKEADFQDVVENENDRKKEGAFGEASKNFKYTLEEKYDRMKSIFGNLSFYKKLLTDDDSKELYEHVIKRLRKILKSIRPRLIKGRLTFGGGTPDTTGYAYGAYCMFKGIIGRDFVFIPDFTKEILEGDILIKGHITVFVLLINAALVYFDRRCRLFIRRIKRHKERKLLWQTETQI